MSFILHVGWNMLSVPMVRKPWILQHRVHLLVFNLLRWTERQTNSDLAGGWYIRIIRLQEQTATTPKIYKTAFWKGLPNPVLVSSSPPPTVSRTRTTKTSPPRWRWSGRRSDGWPTTPGSACGSGTSTRRSRSWAACASCTSATTNLRLSCWYYTRRSTWYSTWSSRSEVSGGGWATNRVVCLKDKNDKGNVFSKNCVCVINKRMHTHIQVFIYTHS